MVNDVELVPCSLTDHNYPLHMAMDKNDHELCQPSQANWESDLELTRRIECQGKGIYMYVHCVKGTLSCCAID